MKYDFELFLSYCPFIGPITYQVLKSKYKTFESLLLSPKQKLIDVIGIQKTNSIMHFKNIFNLQQIKKMLKQKNITFIPQTSHLYPKTLTEIPDPPIGLFAKGNIKLLHHVHLFAVVGSRTTSPYGVHVCKIITTQLAKLNYCIVSGLALGIDSIAHQSALQMKRHTIAVLGCGVDIIYPKAHTNLYHTIIKNNGLILSEVPPQTKTSKALFVTRNRILSGLSKGVLVIEGSQHSGTLITAKYAAAQGRDVFAIPSPIDSPLSFAPNLLLKEGAVVVTDYLDIVDYYK